MKAVRIILGFVAGALTVLVLFAVYFIWYHSILNLRAV